MKESLTIILAACTLTIEPSLRVWDKLSGSVPPMVMSSKSPTHKQINKEEKTTKEWR
jgi:hypothetical protein